MTSFACFNTFDDAAQPSTNFLEWIKFAVIKNDFLSAIIVFDMEFDSSEFSELTR